MFKWKLHRTTSLSDMRLDVSILKRSDVQKESHRCSLEKYASLVSRHEVMAYYPRHLRSGNPALEVIPYTLAENAGMNPISIVTELRSEHAKGKVGAGDFQLTRQCVKAMLKKHVPATVMYRGLGLRFPCFTGSMNLSCTSYRTAVLMLHCVECSACLGHLELHH